MKNISFFICLLLFFGMSGCRENEREMKITEYVNPFIGTSGAGHCFPGAIYPFGGIQLGPDSPGHQAGCNLGYQYSDSVISSFSHTHLSGISNGDLQDIRFLPVPALPDTSMSPETCIQSNYAGFSHANEYAEPGYYSVVFDNGIKTELSVTPHCGIHYYQYPANSSHVLTIDLTTACHGDENTEASIRKVNNRTLEGFRKSRGWAKDQREYFVIEFSQDCKVMAGGDKFMPLQNGQKYTGKKCYAWIDFGEKTDKILAKISLSSANTEGAAANLEKELSHWSFDKVKKDAKQAWRRELQKTRAESKNEDQLKIFYTALYHVYTAPYLFSDVNGNYKGPDGEIHSVSKHDQYTIFPVEYTHRAVHPLFTITQKKRVSNMVNSILKHYDTFGRLPAGELAGNETDSGTGNHSIPVIVEAWLKGIRGFDVEKAYEAIKKTALQDHAGMGSYRKSGYIPCDSLSHPIARTMGYAYDDWCIAQMAKGLQKEDDYLSFLQSSRNYSNLFNPATQSMCAKTSQGEWDNSDQGKESAWLYTWAVPQDVEGLINLLGGRDNFNKRLDNLFTGGLYMHGDKYLHHVMYLYNYTGQTDKAQLYANKVMRECYQNSPEGLCGNEGCGAMSAWYVFSAMGFYPVNPAEGKYQLGSPLFEKVTIKTGPEKKFVITANKENDNYIYIKEVYLNDRKLDRTWITHNEIMDGGELRFVLDTEPQHPIK